ncbi:hypothetical protein [Mycobacterium sp. 236(2023)]|uniref:hypothetical protein n=1 Tax=Mycobacterium sp. 236(2023) TaxID=3038163 RepID=UPI0024154FB1|nr:hypothetical protein [Mycobacterium sp. 236(2023)]MDG4667376.1 hypothetical protein [Mycobacterium sp. 236(2023)]
MRLADTGALTAGSRAVRATVAAIIGQQDDVAAGDAVTFDAVLTIDNDADVPDGASLLEPGASYPAVVQAGPDQPGSEPRRLRIKIPDAYGAGRDQDFLLASSGDGAPLHHAVLPADPVAPLYSSLWLYLAGLQPVLFGVKTPTVGPDVRFGVGDELSFVISPPVGRFRHIGTLSLTKPHEGSVRFAGGNSGDGIRPLPPVNFY